MHTTLHLSISPGVCALAALIAAHAHAQPCLPDADGDGHPLFANTYAYTYVFYHDDGVHVTRATDMALGDLDADGWITSRPMASMIMASSSGAPRTIMPRHGGMPRGRRPRCSLVHGA